MGDPGQVAADVAEGVAGALRQRAVQPRGDAQLQDGCHRARGHQRLPQRRQREFHFEGITGGSFRGMWWLI